MCSSKIHPSPTPTDATIIRYGRRSIRGFPGGVGGVVRVPDGKKNNQIDRYNLKK